MLSAARSKGKLTTLERKRAQALMISVAVSPSEIAASRMPHQNGAQNPQNKIVLLDGVVLWAKRLRLAI